MRYDPLPDVRYDLRSVSNVNLWRLYYRSWERIERIYGPGSWDWPTLAAVFPGWYVLLQAIKTEARRR